MPALVGRMEARAQSAFQESIKTLSERLCARNAAQANIDRYRAPWPSHRAHGVLKALTLYQPLLHARPVPHFQIHPP